tara:strand:+ start:162 stop:347 length:186 start_codon:yes stop_codon:yes gene_type:complete
MKGAAIYWKGIFYFGQNRLKDKGVDGTIRPILRGSMAERATVNIAEIVRLWVRIPPEEFLK